jgi:hypothetical protein
MKRYMVILFTLVIFTTSAMATTKFEVAHVKESGQDMVIIPVNPSFISKDARTQQQIYTDIQVCVRSARLSGTVVLVASGSGRFQFYGPKQWQHFLQSIDMDWVTARINKELSCR